MPMYDYKCESCGARFEAWQKITDEPIATCPTCGAPVHRIIYPVGLVFKGGGFYSTDNKSSSSSTKPAPESASSTDASAAATASAGTGESSSTAPEATKPAATAAAKAE